MRPVPDALQSQPADNTCVPSLGPESWSQSISATLDSHESAWLSQCCPVWSVGPRACLPWASLKALACSEMGPGRGHASGEAEAIAMVCWRGKDRWPECINTRKV